MLVTTSIKPFLSQKDKKIILIIIPLQIISNVASTIKNETAIGSINWAFWVSNPGAGDTYAVLMLSYVVTELTCCCFSFDNDNSPKSSLWLTSSVVLSSWELLSRHSDT